MELMGGCLCGAVRFSVTAEPFAAYYCHCAMRQRNGGGSPRPTLPAAASKPSSARRSNLPKSRWRMRDE